MKQLIPVKLAGTLLLLAFGLLLVVHILIILGILPADIVWGGQANQSELNFTVLEILAILVTIGFAYIVYSKMQFIKQNQSHKSIDVGLWFIFAYLLLNTAGNLASSVSVETWIFAPITLILALCAWRLAVESPH